MNWLAFLAALVRLMTSVADWLRAHALLTAGETKGRAASDDAHARAAAEQGERMREIAAAKPARAEIEKRLEEGGA